MKHLLGIFISSVLTAGAVLGADSILYETDKAFERSQALRGEGIAAFRAGNAALALEKMQAALKERPNHPVLLNYLAYLGAQQKDATTTRQAAEAFLKTGLRPPANTLKLMVENTPENTGLFSRLKTPLPPTGKPEIAFTVNEEARLIEAVAIKDNETAFLSSVAGGTIFKKQGERVSAFFKAETIDAKNFFGIAYNYPTNSLYITYATLDNYGCATKCPTGVVELDASTGVIRRNAFLNASSNSPHQIADLYISDGKRVLLSDAQGRAIYELSGNTLTKIVDMPNSMSPQGLVALKDGNLLVADYGRGIWHIKDGTASLLGTPEDLVLIGLDGLYEKNGKLVAIQNGTNPNRILSLTLSEDQSHIESHEILVQASPQMTEPTLGTFYGDAFYFIGNSQWAKYPNGHHIKEGLKQMPTDIMKIAF